MARLAGGDWSCRITRRKIQIKPETCYYSLITEKRKNKRSKDSPAWPKADNMWLFRTALARETAGNKEGNPAVEVVRSSGRKPGKVKNTREEEERKGGGLFTRCYARRQRGTPRKLSPKKQELIAGSLEERWLGFAAVVAREEVRRMHYFSFLKISFVPLIIFSV